MTNDDDGAALAGGDAGTVAAVVCVHDEQRSDGVRRAINSLQAQVRRVDEIIVVVDHNPGLYERLRLELTGVTTIQNGHQRGLSGARNSAADAAQTSLLAYLDDDAVAAPDWVERLASACRDPSVLGAGGRVIPRWLDGRPGWFPDEFLWVVGCTYRGMPERPARVRNLYGGCFCIRRTVVAELGGFRPELGRVGSNRMGCEETELCIRAGRQWPGAGFQYDPGATIRHDVPAERARWSYFRSRCYAEGVSKARLTRLVGAKTGLSAERSHALRTLPTGVLREAAAAFRDRDRDRIARSAAIAAGLAITTAGYVAEMTAWSQAVGAA